ncbi:MAG: bifunctional phosphoribosyl-AMP cyclohydrolase/phosphoribosyl-ATP diphosphatase HisIE [Candidatus Woesearchaeota archaeon]
MIIPAIDIMNGNAVQLKQGKTKILEVKNINSLIKKFEIFPEINIIDLDAALSCGTNKAQIKNICAQTSCNVGGGIRDIDTANEYLRAGAKHIIIGTMAKKEFLINLPSHRVIVALDIKKGKIAIEGWKKQIEGELKEKIIELEKYCSGFLITNIDVEGLGKGVDINFIESLKNITKNRIIISGGITNYKEIKHIDSLGFDQVIGLAIHTKKIDLHEALLEIIDNTKGLIPTIALDENGQILMLAYSNKESILKTLESKKTTYYSRSRKSLWTKGESSGNTQEFLKINYDCDADTLIYTVKQKGNACHTGKYSCFKEKDFTLIDLIEFLKQRIKNKDINSYTYKISSNNEKLHKKIIEEAFEVTQAQKDSEKIWEIADLMYFVFVYMAKNNIDLKSVINELSLRHRTT